MAQLTSQYSIACQAPYFPPCVKRPADLVLSEGKQKISPGNGVFMSWSVLPGLSSALNTLYLFCVDQYLLLSAPRSCCKKKGLKHFTQRLVLKSLYCLL